MLNLFKTFLMLSLLIGQGCQLLPLSPPKDGSAKSRLEQAQLFRLFRQGERYSKLSAKEKKTVCKRLTLDFQKQDDWQTAWLLVYSLNDNFNCLGLEKTRNLLAAIQSTHNLNSTLRWLNNNQINVLNNLNTLQSKSNSFRAKNRLIKKNNNKLKKQLRKTKIELKDINHKIQALKEMETTVNQNTQQ